MFMQIIAILFIGGFIALAVIGHLALFHALFIRRGQPAPQPGERQLRVASQRKVEAPKSPAPALHVA
jgi:hypothetical protein